MTQVRHHPNKEQCIDLNLGTCTQPHRITSQYTYRCPRWHTMYINKTDELAPLTRANNCRGCNGEPTIFELIQDF